MLFYPIHITILLIRTNQVINIFNKQLLISSLIGYSLFLNLYVLLRFAKKISFIIKLFLLHLWFIKYSVNFILKFFATITPS